MRMRAEGLSATEAVCAVLADNLHGLELDPGCSKIAAFALALGGLELSGCRWLPRAGAYGQLADTWRFTIDCGSPRHAPAVG